jgi:hypothetical protein
MDPRHEIPFETACRGINHDLYGLGSSHKDGCNIATADGIVYFENDNTDMETLKAAFTKSGNEAFSGF